MAPCKCVWLIDWLKERSPAPKSLLRDVVRILWLAAEEAADRAAPGCMGRTWRRPLNDAATRRESINRNNNEKDR